MVIKQSHGGLNYKWDPKVPNEVRIMKLLNKTHCRGMVRLRAYRRYCHKKVHRLYLRYCPHGDLRRLIDRYRRFRQVDLSGRADGLPLTVSGIISQNPSSGKSSITSRTQLMQWRMDHRKGRMTTMKMTGIFRLYIWI